MTDASTYFTSCVNHEKAKLCERMDWESRGEWPQPSFVKEVRKLLGRHPGLNVDIGGISGAVDSLKAAARGDNHAEKIRRVVVRQLCSDDTEDVAARRVLRSMLEKQSTEDSRWSRVPIRLYGCDAPLAPCIDENGGLHTRRDLSTETWATFDAAWLWGGYCVYGWHRWAHTSVDVSEINRLIARCAKAKESLYQDKPPRFVLMIHGAAWERTVGLSPLPQNVILAAPWEVAEALATFK
jgi:hypothetical protein